MQYFTEDILATKSFMILRSPTEDENGTLFLNPGLASNRYPSLYATPYQLVTPERFNRGSSPKFPWIPAKSMRE